jgi:hypothetical protein
LSKVSYNGDYVHNFFAFDRGKINEVITKLQGNYPELKEELEYWKLNNKGTKFTNKQTVFPLHRGKKVNCGFLKIYESGEEDILYCFSIIGSISIKVKSTINRAFGWIGLSNEEKKCINMIKSCPKIMAALIMSEGSGLRIRWEEQNVPDELEN